MTSSEVSSCSKSNTWAPLDGRFNAVGRRRDVIRNMCACKGVCVSVCMYIMRCSWDASLTKYVHVCIHAASASA